MCVHQGHVYTTCTHIICLYLLFRSAFSPFRSAFSFLFASGVRFHRCQRPHARQTFTRHPLATIRRVRAFQRVIRIHRQAVIARHILLERAHHDRQSTVHKVRLVHPVHRSKGRGPGRAATATCQKNYTLSTKYKLSKITIGQQNTSCQKKTSRQNKTSCQKMCCQKKQFVNTHM